MRKICIITNQHLCNNPRVWKEARSLAINGYKVTIITTWTSAISKEKDMALIEGYGVDYVAALNLIPSETTKTIRFLYRLKNRLALIAKLFLGLELPLLLGNDPKPVLKFLKNHTADLYICHVDQSLYIGKILMQNGKRVAYDFEDWYSRDYLVPSRPVKLLENLEQFALQHGVYCTCPSATMAIALASAYSTQKIVKIIYNGFSIEETTAANPINGKPDKSSLVWFSQTIGPGRGLETLMKALQFVHSTVQLHLIGDCTKDYQLQLEKLFKGAHSNQLFFHPPIPHSQLLSTLSRHTIGLALENSYPDSRDTTITNKILQYLQAGIKVLATATKGQQEVAPFFPDTIALVDFEDVRGWAANIEKLLQAPPVDQSAQASVFNLFFSWEAQEKKLLTLVDNALTAP